MVAVTSMPYSETFAFFIYRYRFLALYTLYGVGSLLIELRLTSFLLYCGFPVWGSYFLGIATGILFAFVMNFFFNFKIPPRRIFYALSFFIVISVASFIFQFFIRDLMKEHWTLSPERSRFFISGVFFFFSYLLHRKLTFHDYKKVGVAVYANETEDISGIFQKVYNFPAFIHVDFVDETFSALCAKPEIIRTETIHAYWHRKNLEVHIMSKTPSRYIDYFANFASTIYFHSDIEDDIGQVISQIRSHDVNPGIAFRYDTSPEEVKKALQDVSRILILAIENPGQSGQHFQESVFQLVSRLNNLPERNSFELCVDGGINVAITARLNVEKVISASYVLHSSEPKRTIMNLKTSGKYDSNNRDLA